MLLQYILIVLIILFPLTFLTSYLIAVLLGHAPADFPYISDTGTNVPESCVFGLMLNFCAILFGLVVFLRFLQVREYQKAFGLSQLTLPNFCLLFTGGLAAFGVCIVANFQETSIFTMHIIGAFTAFISAGLFMVIEAHISFRLSSFCIAKSIVAARSIIAALHFLSFILTNVFGAFASQSFYGETKRDWKPTDGGWYFHLCSTLFEWIMCFLIVVFLVTYGHEFHHTHVYLPPIKIFVREVTMPSESAEARNA